MKIKWLGHSCFLFTSKSGVKVLTDPFNDQVGYRLPSEEADIVTVSHGHFDHDNIGVVRGDFVHIDKPGKYSIKGIEILGISTFHDEEGGAKRGKNTVFKFDIGGIKICHCGDLGHVLTAERVKEIGEVNILLVPVGGTYTVDAAGASEVVGLLKPDITIPMHFKTEVLDFPIDGVNKFLDVSGGGEMAGKTEIEFDRNNMKQFAKIIVLDYK